MQKYSVLIEGKNIFIKRDKIEKVGFYTTRWIEAENQRDAEEKAIEYVKGRARFIGCVV